MRRHNPNIVDHHCRRLWNGSRAIAAPYFLPGGDWTSGRDTTVHQYAVFRSRRGRRLHPIPNASHDSYLAYIGIIYLGVQASHDHWRGRLHHRKRCDLSHFQLGRRFLAFYLREGKPITEGLLVPPELPASPILSN